MDQRIESNIERTFRLRQRLMDALECLRLETSKNYIAFTDWLRAELMEDKAEFMITVRSDLKSVGCYVAGPATAHVENTLAFIAAISEEEGFRRLEEAGQRLEPQSMGYWLQLAPGHLAAGWHFPCICMLSRAMESAIPSADREALLQWAGDHNITTCLQLECSVGTPPAATELSVLLPHHQGTEYLGAAKALFNRFDIPWWGIEMENTLQHLDAEVGGLIVAFTQEGVSRLGLLIKKPSSRLTLTLAGLSDNFSYKTLACFEGRLLTEGPDFILLYQNNLGIEALCHYVL